MQAPPPGIGGVTSNSPWNHLMPLREKLILFVILLLGITTLSLTSVWYRDTNLIINSYAEETASSLMKDAYNAFSYLLTDTEYLSSLVILNRENIIAPLQIINTEAKTGGNQLTYNQLINKRLIDSYIGSMYGHKYYITGISVVSTSGYLFKTGEASYYPLEIIGKLDEYGVSQSERRMILLPPVNYGLVAANRQNHFVVPAVRNIMDIEGKPVGFVIIYFDYMIIKDIFSNNLPPDSIFEVSDKFGNKIFSNTGADINSLNDKKQFYVKSHYYAEKAGWDFDMAIPMAEVRRQIKSTLSRTLLIMSVIALAAILIGILAVYRMTKNLEKLNLAMMNISQGNLAYRAGIEGRDEIGKMGKIFDKMASDITDLLVRISDEEKQKRKTELDFLQAQINPHFVSNTLNTIIWMAKMNNADNIVLLTKSLSALIQSSMRRGSQFILIKDEIEYTKNYVEIQKYSFYDFEIDFIVKDAVESFYTPRFILQPLVENAIVHGISENKDNHKIEVSAFRTGNSVRIEVFDNGKGMDQSQIEKLMDKTKNTYSSIGIRNIQERIKLFFGKNYGLSFESREDEYTKAVLIIPLLPESDLGKADE
jgi:two-component system sensor histidine kinase YesM